MKHYIAIKFCRVFTDGREPVYGWEIGECSKRAQLHMLADSEANTRLATRAEIREYKKQLEKGAHPNKFMLWDEGVIEI